MRSSLILLPNVTFPAYRTEIEAESMAAFGN